MVNLKEKITSLLLKTEGLLKLLKHVNMAAKKEMIKRKDGSYSQRGLWDNIRANAGSGKKATPAMKEQERKIKAKEKKKKNG
jgi:hypothetical protein